MDVSNLNLSGYNQITQKNYYIEPSNRVLEQNNLKKHLLLARQYLQKQNNSITTSFEATAKLTLAEKHINSGNFYAAEQIIQEVSKQAMIEENNQAHKKQDDVENQSSEGKVETEDTKTTHFHMDDSNKLLSYLNNSSKMNSNQYLISNVVESYKKMDKVDHSTQNVRQENDLVEKANLFHPLKKLISTIKDLKNVFSNQ